MGSLKPYITTAIVVLVTLAIVMRVKALRDVVGI